MTIKCHKPLRPRSVGYGCLLHMLYKQPCRSARAGSIAIQGYKRLIIMVTWCLVSQVFTISVSNQGLF